MIKNSHFVVYCVILLQIWGAFLQQRSPRNQREGGGREGGSPSLKYSCYLTFVYDRRDNISLLSKGLGPNLRFDKVDVIVCAPFF